MHVVAGLNASLAYPWMELVFDHQDEFGNEETILDPPAKVIRHFAQLAEKLGVDEGDVLAGFRDPASAMATRTSFKYGCSRSVVATPSYLVNGVHVEAADETWTITDWKRLLDPLVRAGDAVRLPL
eukprot:SM000050S17019  [mRNA]  locus=s50:413295:414135:- [translate_table: standard]